jgi:hypothetical protein
VYLASLAESRMILCRFLISSAWSGWAEGRQIGDRICKVFLSLEMEEMCSVVELGLKTKCSVVELGLKTMDDNRGTLAWEEFPGGVLPAVSCLSALFNP